MSKQPDIDDPYAALGEAVDNAKRGKRKAKSEIQDPHEGANQADIRKVTAHGHSVYHGRMNQVTFRISDEYKEAIEQIAASERMSKEEVKRWLLGMGLRAYYTEGERPEVEERVVTNRAKLPQVKL